MKYISHKKCGGWLIFPFEKEGKPNVGYCLNCTNIVSNPNQMREKSFDSKLSGVKEKKE